MLIKGRDSAHVAEHRRVQESAEGEDMAQFMEEDTLRVSLVVRDWASAEEQLVCEVGGADADQGIRGGSVPVHSGLYLVCGTQLH